MLTRMTDSLDVYARVAESETLEATLSAVPAWIGDEPSASGALKQDPMMELQLTHVARVPYELAREGPATDAAPASSAGVIETGNRVKRQADGAEFLVKGIRHHNRPGHRYAVLLLSRAGHASGV